MKESHHSLTMEAAIDYMLANSAAFPLDNHRVLLQDLNAQLDLKKRLSKWVYAPDLLDDVIIEDGLAKDFLKTLKDSKMTSFQHFAYCGLLGDLHDGKTTVKKNDGYCWDCDPFLGCFVELLGDATNSEVSYKTDCGYFSAMDYQKSPGKLKISGKEDWDNQIYPSAIEMAEFYGGLSIQYRSQKSVMMYQAQAFAIHFIQDMVIPHHILCTILNGHSDYEAELLSYWQKIYGIKGIVKKNDIQDNMTKYITSYLNQWQLITSYGELCQTVMETTAKKIDLDSFWNTNKIVAFDHTVLAIAATIKALSF